MPRPKTYKKREKKRVYQLSRKESPEDMVIRLFKRGRSINFIVKKVEGMDKETVTGIVKNSSKTKRLWKQEELKERIKQKSSKVIDLQRENGEFRDRIIKERDVYVAKHKKALEDHFDKRLKTAVNRRIREYDYRIRKHMTVEGVYGDLHFHKALEYDFLKFSLLAFQFIENRYDLTRLEVDTLLFLHSEGTFYRKDIPQQEGKPSVFKAFIDKRMINIWRIDRDGNKLYTISDKATSIVNELYTYMTGKKKVPTTKLRKTKANASLSAVLKKLNKLTS